jgi:K+-sensing histidine kinase KdpD
VTAYLFTGILTAAIIGILWVSILLILGLKQKNEEQPTVEMDKKMDYPHPVLLVSKGGKVKYHNDEMARLVGLKNGQDFDINTLAKKSKKKDFYRIFTKPGTNNFRIDDDDYASYGYQTNDGMLVTFQKINPWKENLPVSDGIFPTSLNFLEKIFSHEDLDQIITLVINEIQNRIPAEWIEIALWDAEKEEVVSYQTRVSGNTPILEPLKRYYVNECFAGKVISQRKKIYQNNFNPDQTSSAEDGLPSDLREILGIPLWMNKDITGAIVLGSYEPVDFSQKEQALEPHFLKEISIGLYVAWLSHEVTRKSSELSDLSKLSYTINKIQDPQIFFKNILSSFENLLPVDIFGFILYEEQTNILEAKKPFKGLPDPIVDIIRITIAPDSPAEHILFSQDILIVENAMDNQQWTDLGLSHLASAASIREAVLIPLSPGSEPMGYLLAANHHNHETSFSKDEMHLLMIVANQTAPLIENLYLLLQSRQRTQRAEALRRISSLASSSATVNELLAFSINELSLLLQADVGGLFLLDQSTMKLEWNQDSRYGEWQLDDANNELLPSSSDFHATVTLTKEPLVIGKFDETKPVPSFYQKIIDQCDLQSAIIVPMVVKNQGIGEIWFGSHSLSFFDQGDIQLIHSAANQLAYVVDQSNLSMLTLEAINEKMEQEKLIDELQKINQFSQKITSLRPRLILQELLDVLIDFIPVADAGWIGVWDENHQSLRAEHVRNYSESLLNINFETNSLPHEVCNHKKIVVLNGLDFPLSYGLSENDAVQYLRGTQHQIPTACLMAPITAAYGCVGTLVLEIFNHEKSFSEEDESLTGSFLQQVNLALSNADLFITTEKQSERLKILSDISKSMSGSLNKEELQHSMLKQLHQLVDFRTATLWEKGKSTLKIIATDGFADQEERTGLVVQIEDSPLFQEMFATKRSVVVADIREDQRFPALISAENLSWLGIPLITKEEVMAVIALEQKESNYYQDNLVQLAEAFASQAAIALENASLYQESTRRTSELNERTQKLTWLNQFSSEVNRSLDIAYIESLTAEYLMNVVRCEMISIFLLDAENEIKLSFQRPEIGSLPKLLIDQQPFFDTLSQSRGVYQIQNVAEEKEIEVLNTEYFAQRGTKSILFIPLQRSNEVFGWVGLESSNSRRFTHNEIELAMTITNQAALAINNATLLTETIGLKENLEERVEERTQELVLEHRSTEMLLNISNELARSMDVDQFLDSTLSLINQAMGVSGSLVYLQAGKKIIQAIHHPSDNQGSVVNESIENYFQQLLSVKKSILVGDLSTESSATPFSSWLFIPLKFGDSILGILSIFQQTPEFFTHRDLKLAEAIAGQISLALNNTEIFTLIRDQSENLGSLLRDQEVEASRSQAILEAVADGVLVTGTQSEILLLNKSAHNILGIAENSIERSLPGLQNFFGEKVTQWLSNIQRWTEKPAKILTDAVISEKIYLNEHQVISVHLSPVLWRNEFLGTVSVFRDITMEVQIDQLKTDFISNISHELRTPMTSIKGYVEVLLMEASGKINEQQKHFLEIIQSNTNRLTSLVDDILDVSRIESGRIVLRPQSIDLVSKINEMVEIHKNISMNDSKQVDYHVEMLGKIPKIMADPQRMEQVVLNILNNARIYSYHQGVIKITVETFEKFIKIVFTDQGVGVPIDEQEHIFERFYRGRNALNMNSAGTGLGLAIARILIEMHAGKITLQSSGIPGEGSSVIVMLPINQEQGAD